MTTCPSASDSITKSRLSALGTAALCIWEGTALFEVCLRFCHKVQVVGAGRAGREYDDACITPIEVPQPKSPKLKDQGRVAREHAKGTPQQNATRQGRRRPYTPHHHTHTGHTPKETALKQPHAPPAARAARCPAAEPSCTAPAPRWSRRTSAAAAPPAPPPARGAGTRSAWQVCLGRGHKGCVTSVLGA